MRTAFVRPRPSPPSLHQGRPARHVARCAGNLQLPGVFALFLSALLALGVWIIAVVAFQVTSAAIHLLLVLAIALFAVGFMRRQLERPHRPVA
jgi:hypothetical protein